MVGAERVANPAGKIGGLLKWIKSNSIVATVLAGRIGAAGRKCMSGLFEI